MNAIFGNLTTEGLEETEDRLGGFRVHETDAYLATIKAAYAGKSANSNAQSVTFIFELPGGIEYRETLWITNRNGENFFLNKQDPSKKVPLPGFTVVDDICLVTSGKPLSQQNSEDKVINVYDPEQKKEMPKSVPMLVELLGQQVTLGLTKQVVNKQTKNANGEYVDTDESREENVIDKVFHHPSNLTVVEARQGVQTATFYGSWVEKNRGQTRDKRSKNGGQGGQTGRPGSAPKAGQGQAKTTSLFGPN